MSKTTIGGQLVDDDPEPTCGDCGGLNFVWFVESDLWNFVVPERVAFICPRCFTIRAEKVLLGVTSWRLVPESEPHYWQKP